MNTTALVMIVIFAANLGAAITLICLTIFDRSETDASNQSDSSMDDFVKYFTEILTHQANRIEEEFTQRLSAKAKDVINKAGISNRQAITRSDTGAGPKKL